MIVATSAIVGRLVDRLLDDYGIQIEVFDADRSALFSARPIFELRARGSLVSAYATALGTGPSVEPGSVSGFASVKAASASLSNRWIPELIPVQEFSTFMALF
ncbi:hypothetical protein MSIMFI_03909 [Mycobacterium simulans]|nr:hypothetical protein MSIMFI_03909 [Mycobacterium simulans]